MKDINKMTRAELLELITSQIKEYKKWQLREHIRHSELEYQEDNSY
jgi:hypothetical protein